MSGKEGGIGREERGRSIAAAAASSEVTIAIGRTDGGWNGQINRADGGGLVASSPNCSTKGGDDDGDPDYQRGRGGEVSWLCVYLYLVVAAIPNSVDRRSCHLHLTERKIQELHCNLHANL